MTSQPAQTPYPESQFPRPRIVVSRCLGFDHCRYDGSTIPNPIVKALGEFVDYITPCPEVEIGLGAPRPPVRIVQTPQGPRLLQPATGRDVTDAMQAFAQTFLDSLPPVDGFILKNRSPSCGIKDAKIYASADKGPAVGTRPGFFGGAVLERFPDLPVEDEGRLTNRAIREHFFTVIFALADLRQVVQEGRMAALVDFHSRHKFLLMVYHQARLRELGRIVANPEKRPTSDLIQEYAQGFRAALARPPRRPAVYNALTHALGYVSERLSPSERAFFLQTLQPYREGRVPLSAPLAVLRSWIVRFGVDYLAQQSFFFPFPEALIIPLDSGCGEV